MKIKQLLTKENIIKSLKWFFFSYIWLAIVLFILDIVTKTIVKENMKVGQNIWLIPNFLSINYVQNNGMGFGIEFGNVMANTIIFILVSLIGAIALIIITWKFWKKLTGVSKAALMLMICGTIGNLIDRSFYIEADGQHFVVDWIGFTFGSYNFPRFNVADSCLTIGTIMLIVFLFVVDIKSELKKKKQEQLMSDEEYAQSQNQTVKVGFEEEKNDKCKDEKKDE